MQQGHRQVWGEVAAADTSKDLLASLPLPSHLSLCYRDTDLCITEIWDLPLRYVAQTQPPQNPSTLTGQPCLGYIGEGNLLVPVRSPQMVCV